ncbi:MAG: MFS transporter [Eubacterium sp.]
MDNKTYVPKKEWVAYCVGALGQGMVYGIMSSYISDFYLNVLKVTPLFVLLLMLFARIWDAINDPIMGFVVDHLNPKNGKMKPYLLYTPVPVAILTMLLFTAPNLADSQKMIYAAITYVAWGMIYTSSDVPFWSLPNALTPNADERGSIISKARTFNGVGSAVPMAMFMILGFVLPKFNLSGTQLEQTKYSLMALVCSIIGNILFIRVYFKSKERVNIPIPAKKEKGQPSSLKLILTCKPLMLTAIMGVLSAARYMFQAGAVHVARYSFYIGKDPTGLTGAELEQALQGNISKVSMVMSVASAVGMFGAMIAVTPLIKKFSYKQIIVVSSLMGAASSLAIWFIGYEHFWACVPLLVISTIPCGTINVCAYAMVGDCLDYMELKTGVRLTGMGSAIQSFVTKFGNAIATSAIILMYIVVDLDVSKISASYTANPLDVDPAVRTGIFSIVSLIPAISLLICIIPMFFYKITGEYRDRMEAQLAEQRKARGIEIE